MHVAPAIDMRLSVPASGSQAPNVFADDTFKDPGPPAYERIEVESRGDDVSFGLPFPVEERSSRLPPRPEGSPDTFDFERPRTTPTGDFADERTPMPAHWNAGSEPPTLEGDREALLRDLIAIGGLPSSADRISDREVPIRATIARARALRFRLMLHDVWSEAAWPVAVRARDPRPLHIDLSLDAALLVAIADGAPPPTTGSETYAMPWVRPLVDFLRAERPDLPRSALRDRGASAIARLTIVGWRGALEHITKSARAVPEGARQTALELAARVSLTPMLNDHRFAALSDLERALALPTGSVARALDDARKPL